MPQDLTLFKAMTAKMSWLEQRQKVIAQNLANADTPGYVPQDLVPVDFQSMLKSSASAHSMKAGGGVGVSKTNPAHMQGGGLTESPAKEKAQKKVYETAPAGNKVIIEEQLLKADEIRTDHQLMINLYEKNRDLLRKATGSN